MSVETQSSLVSYKELIFVTTEGQSQSVPVCETMEETLKQYIFEEYTSLETIGKEIGLAKSTIYDYFKDGIPDDVFAVICFKLKLHPLRIFHLLFKGTGYRLDYNGDERNSVIVYYLLMCRSDSSFNYDSYNAELKDRRLRLINQNA